MKHVVYLICNLNDSMISEMSFLRAKLFLIKQIAFSQIYIFEIHDRTDIGTYSTNFSLSPSLYLGVIRPMFISSGKILWAKKLLNIQL